MSKKEVKGNEESDEDEEEETLLLLCRKCPGKSFTPAEKDAHQLLHENEKKERKKRKASPESKTRPGDQPATERCIQFEI